MSEIIHNKSTAQLNATTISTDKKEKHLTGMSEDDFRDLVIRPIYTRRGLTFVRHTCGTDEEGKDCIFLSPDPLGLGKSTVLAMQTKRGNMNLTSKASENLESAVAQLRTALATDIHLTTTKQKVKPDCIVLCVSGRINEAARKHITANLDDPRIRFLDSTDIIPMLDSVYPEFWYNIDATKFPYLRSLKESLISAQDAILIQSSTTAGQVYTAITDENYVELYLDRVTSKPVNKTKTIPLPGRHFRRETVTERELSIDQLTINGILSRPERLVLVVGDGGSGKTTALRHLAFRLADMALRTSSASSTPVLASAALIARSPGRLVEDLGSISQEIVGRDEVPFTTEDLNHGRVLVLIDALDEVAAVESKKAVIDKILSFHQEYPECLVVLTTRRHSYLQENASISRFARYELTSIDMRQAAKIIEHVAAGRKLPRETAEEVVRRLQLIHGMELSPMLVARFVATTDFTKKDIPANITEVFSKFTEQMLGRWDEKKGLSHQYQSNVKDFLLCKIAFQMHSRKVRTMSLSACREVFHEFLEKRGYQEDAEELFNETIYRSGLLRVEGDSMEFRHQLIQEFFAGRGAPSVDFFKTVVVDEWWRNPAVFYFGANQKTGQKDILELAHALSGKSGNELFRAAVTVGLAIQACYLAETKDKAEVLIWVIDAFSEINGSFCESLKDEKVKFPLHKFLQHYLEGRDSVGCDAVVDAMEWYRSHPPTNDKDIHRYEVSMFWCIVGLIESGNLGIAEPIIKAFKPSDDRLLAAIDLGCFYAAHQRIVKPTQKAIARSLHNRIAPKIRGLMTMIIEEHKGILLERRNREILVLDKDVRSRAAARRPALLNPPPAEGNGEEKGT